MGLRLSLEMGSQFLRALSLGIRHSLDRQESLFAAQVERLCSRIMPAIGITGALITVFVNRHLI